MPTAYGLAPLNGASPSGQTTWYQFSSRHLNLVNFTFQDGSVRPITQSADYWTFQLAGAMNDGLTLNFSLIGQ